MDKYIKRNPMRDRDECQTSMPENCCSMRENAKAGLLHRAKRLRDEAHALEKLADELPGHLSQEADQALWNLVEQIRR